MTTTLASRAHHDANAQASVATIGVVLASLGTAYIAAAHPGAIRWVFAAGVVAAFLVFSLRWPRIAVLVLMLFLPILALVRRILIPVAGFASFDPLLLIAPAAAALVLIRLFLLEGRRIPRDALSRLVVVVLAISILQVFNPAGEGLIVGLPGLLFVAAPMLWFLVGRELANRALVSALVVALVFWSIPLSLYGVWQLQMGLPSWDAEWVDLNGYEALFVNDSIRAFGTFSSGQEYAVFASAAAVFAVAIATSRRYWALLLVPVPMVAILLSAVRTSLVLFVLATVVVLGVRTRRLGVAIAVIVVGLGAAVVGTQMLGADVRQSASANPFLEHQVSGLSDPLNAQESSLTVHAELVATGITGSLAQPLGYGTGSTTLAATRFAEAGARSTEVDAANAFVEWGLVGGALFLAIVLLALTAPVRLYFRTGDWLALAVLGLLLVALGAWVGGLYAVAPLVWLLLGWTARELAMDSGLAPE
jgi:hypothetical protein